jgi:hypothetical protein
LSLDDESALKYSLAGDGALGSGRSIERWSSACA